MPTVTFAIQLQNRLVHEAELSAHAHGQHINNALDRYPFSGGVCFHMDGQVAILEDRLDYLFGQLVGDGWWALHDCGQLQFLHDEYAGEVSIKIEDGILTLEDTYLNSHLLFLADEVLPGLVACVERYVKFLQGLNPNRSDVEADMQRLETVLARHTRIAGNP